MLPDYSGNLGRLISGQDDVSFLQKDRKIFIFFHFELVFFKFCINLMVREFWFSKIIRFITVCHDREFKNRKRDLERGYQFTANLLEWNVVPLFFFDDHVP